jgi:hypothetical protein
MLENTESKMTIQRNWQHGVSKTKTNKTKTQHNMCFDTTIRIQTEIAQIPHASPYKQLEV